MTDLTVLVSPMPLYPETRDFTFGRRSKSPHTRPIMVTLETEIEEADRAQKSPIDKPIDTDFINPPTSPPKRSRTPRIVEPHLLSPPVNTWKSKPRHRPTRSHSAPPERRAQAPIIEQQIEREPVRFNTEALGFRQRNPNRSFTSFSTVDRNTTRGGELVRPPPPLPETESLMGANSQSLYRSAIIPTPVATTGRVTKRQTADVSPTATTSEIPIFISFLSTIPSTSDSDAGSISSSSMTSQPDSSDIVPSSSSQISAIPSAALSTTKSPFSPIDLIPAFAVVGVFLIGLCIWVLYGCCTRRPRILKDDGELITGPPYVGLQDSDPRRDVEHRGQDQDMISIHKYSRAHVNAQYRWPSYSEPPVFDQKTGFHAPGRYLHDHGYDEDDEDTNLLSASLHAPERSRSTHAIPPSSSALAPAFVGDSSHHGYDTAVSRQHSSATSAALHELYESDSEEDARRRAREPPWESLRHKSIKRGILDQVKKENTWMDSLRSSLMGVGTATSEAAIAVPGAKRQRRNVGLGEEESMHDEVETRVSSSNKVQNGVGRRRGHTRANSDIHITCNLNAIARDITAQEKDPIPTSKRTHRKHDLRHPSPAHAEKFTRNPNNIIAPPPKLGRGRRSYAWLKDAESEDRYTPLPARLNASRSRSPNRSESHSKSRSRSTSPIKPLLPRPQAPTTKRSVGGNTPHPLPHDGGDEGQLGEGQEYSVIARALEILPQSPPQIMSPPLESQICFTPIPPLSLSPKNASTRTSAKTSATRSPSRSRSAQPTRIPSPKKNKLSEKTRDNSRSRSAQRSIARSNAHDTTGALPPTSVLTSNSTTRDASRTGRRSQKSSSRGITSPTGGDRTFSPPLALRKMPRDEIGTDSIMRKVDQIMEDGWNERHLGLEAIRSLSPTGFGRDV